MASKENLEAILQEFANRICERHGIRFFNGGFKVLLEDEMIPDVLLVAGNPVLIRFSMRLIADAFLNNKIILIKHQLHRALEISSKKMLHTLSQTPVAPAIKKDDIHDTRWVKQATFDKLLPNLLPESRVMFTVYHVVTATDNVTGETWTEKGWSHKSTIGELERRAYVGLSKAVLYPEKNNEEKQEPDVVQVEPNL